MTSESSSREPRKIVFLGCGQTARALISGLKTGDFGAVENLELVATTREEGRLMQIAAMGAAAILLPAESDKLKAVCRGADVLVTFPPDGESDSLYAQLVGTAGRIVYISSTGVYGNYVGIVDEDTAVQVDGASVANMRRLAAEDIWRNVGATVLRAPGLYSPVSGLHHRLRSGNYRLPANGTNYVSRIHLDDLAAVIMACFAGEPQADTYVVGDLKPCPHVEVVGWLCERLGLPLPDSAPLDQVSPTLRGNRQVNAAKILAEFGITLRYPTYVEGYTQCLAKSSSS